MDAAVFDYGICLESLRQLLTDSVGHFAEVYCSVTMMANQPLSASRLRILWISLSVPYFPGPGSATRQYSFLHRFVEHHDVTAVLSVRPGLEPHLAKLEELGIAVYPVKLESSAKKTLGAKTPRYVRIAKTIVSQAPRMIQTLSDWETPFAKVLGSLNSVNFDIVQVEYSDLAGLVEKWLPNHKAFLIDFADIFSEVQWSTLSEIRPFKYRLLWLLDTLKLVSLEARLARTCTRCLVCSERDKSHLKRLAPGAKISVVPNTTNTDYFSPRDIKDKLKSQAPVILFTGTMSYEPNRDAALYFAKEILPLIWTDVPQARFLVVGRDPSADLHALERDERIVVTGEVSDVRPYMEEAEVIVVPLLKGSGTRIKILEAWSMRKSVVSTSKGCAGIDCRHGEHILIADAPGDFAEAVVKLLQEPAFRSYVAERGYQLVRAKYDWTNAVELLEQAYEKALLYSSREPISESTANQRSDGSRQLPRRYQGKLG